MIALVTLAEAKTHLRITESYILEDADISLKILMASDIVLNYIERIDADEWLVNTSPLTWDIPPLIQAATFLVLGELYIHREASARPAGLFIGELGPLSDAVCSLLRRYRLPAMG